jgi:hypothetical protein
VGFRLKLALPGLAAICLSGLLHAQSTYEVPIPDSGTPAKFELYVTYSPTDAVFDHAAALEFTVPGGSLYTAPAISLGDWEVTVYVDVVRCGIYCAYRRKRETSNGTFLLDLLQPPVTAIRVYTGSAARPAILFVDPAGLKLPVAASNIVITSEALGILGRRLFRSALAPVNASKSLAPQPAPLLALTHNLKTTASATLSLRI